VREIVEDVRKRDAERLVLQQARGLGAGGSVFAPNKATPEPLVKPRTGRDGEPTGPKRRPRGQKPLSVRLAEESAAAD
jgi:CPA2 family monovalent cation:H+ antiporter-2